MQKYENVQQSYGITRRDFTLGAMITAIGWSLSSAQIGPESTIRAINILNFIRAEDPRQPINLFEPVQQQMRLIKAQQLPATWLLQYDALVEGPFVDFLKAEMPVSHEVGIWLEMNKRICEDAGIKWRGNPAWEWDYHVPVAYTIGYRPDERRRLADTAMAMFKKTFGRQARSVASWNLDAITLAHLSDHYGIDAFGNCRDQLATDGFTIWGAPIAAYFPCRLNAWSPALEEKRQINTPVFRLLGQDPVYYYDNRLPYPDTMEPVWPSGQSKKFVDEFLKMITISPTQAIAYVQLGQENSFGWPMMRDGYAMQIGIVGGLQKRGHLVVETMGETGRRFKSAHKSTPTQAQVMLEDPYGHNDPAEKTVWYQSKYFRANLHVRGEEFYFRDLHVYNDAYPQPFLEDPVKVHGIDQKMLAVLDGYHWSDGPLGHRYEGKRAAGRFFRVEKNGNEVELRMMGDFTVEEGGPVLRTTIPTVGGSRLIVVFKEKEIEFREENTSHGSRLLLRFVWNIERSALKNVKNKRVNYSFRGFDYDIRVLRGKASQTADGAEIAGTAQGIRILMAQGEG